MKNKTIKTSLILREISFLLLSFAVVLVINIVGISKHGVSWKEMLGQLHVVLIFTLIIYLLIWFIRLLVLLAGRPIKRK